MEAQSESGAKPQLTLIAAMDEDRLIATAQGIPWHLPRDVAHFREYTKDKWLLLGRRTYRQMRGWFREGHRPLVLTRRTDWKPEIGATVASIVDALKITADSGQTELVCCGGGEVYAAALPYASRMVLTMIQHRFAAGEDAVHFPQWRLEDWENESATTYLKDSENAYTMSVVTWRSKLGAL